MCSSLEKQHIKEYIIIVELNEVHPKACPWIIIIIKRISRAPIYHTRWQHRALYNNTNHTHT